MNLIWALQHTSLSFALDEEEALDGITLFETEFLLDTYIVNNKIQLGRHHMYDDNYELYTKIKLKINKE